MYLLYFIAPPSFEIKKRTQTALISENTVLQCEAKGEKPIGILWNMNNKRLDTNVDPRYTIREEIQEDGVLSTIRYESLQKLFLKFQENASCTNSILLLKGEPTVA